MVTCAVVSCPNRTNPDRADNKKGVRFFNIPKLVVHQCSLTKSRTQRRRAAWIARINRKDLQDADVKPYHRVCSAHFVSGSPSKLWEETSPDWAPSINLGYSTIKAASSTSLARYNRVKRRNQDKLVLSQHQAQNHGQPMDIREDVEKEICNVPRTEEPAPVPDYHGQEDSASAGHNDAVIRLNSEPVTEGNLVSTEQKLAVKREVYESLRNELLELKQRFQQVRDRLTEVEVDKLELQTSLKSHYDESQCLKSELKKKEERMILRLKEKEVHIQANYENRLQESLKEIKKQKQCIAEADKLTFRNSEVFASNEKKVQFYTGLPSFAVFKSVLDTVTSYISELCTGIDRFLLEPWQCLLLTLMRLRLSLVLQDLAYRFGVSISTACRTFDRWVDALYHCVVPAMIKWPDRETLWETMPRGFREAYGKSVAVIVDCFEVFTEKPSALETRAILSNYKHHNTVKILIGISPTGAIIFVSTAWGARASDKHIVQQSGLYELLLPHDVVIADRGFTIAEDLALHQAKLLIPAFTRGQDQLTKKIANLHIHVERVIGLVRNKYRILKSILPVETLVKKCDYDIAPIDKIVRVCCALTNMCPSIVVHPEIQDEVSE